MSQNVAWIDLETTGTNEKVDKVIEIACIITNKNWLKQDSFNAVIHPEPMPKNIAPIVLDMHTKNGLWGDVMASSLTTEGADINFAQFLSGHLGGVKQLVLAGSGVSHFDRRFIDAQLPISAKLLTFWSYDVGSVRRFLECAGIKGIKNVKKHRAMGDIEQHLEDWITAITIAKEWHIQDE